MRKLQGWSRLALGVCVVGLGIGAIGMRRDALPARLVALAPASFSDTDDAQAQIDELRRFVEARARPSSLLQVDLATHRKVSQFTDIDASGAGFGRNACGLVAAAAALGGEDWTPLVGEIARAAGGAYHRYAGIQPSPYVAALQRVFGAERVWALDRSSLGALYGELEAGRVVIVDIKVNDRRAVPSVEPPNYAHFARVLGLDVGAEEIYIENSLRGDSYWTMSLTDFVDAWQRPETTSSIILDPRGVEDKTRWAVVVDRAEER